MKPILLTVPDCPNAAVFEDRLAVALAGRPDAVVRRREVVGEREAARAGMCGSPTLLINGGGRSPCRARYRAWPSGSTGT